MIIAPNMIIERIVNRACYCGELEMEKVFITGALGALGSNLILNLLNHPSSYKIIATDLYQDISADILSELRMFPQKGFEKKLEYFSLDITDSKSLMKLLIKTKPDYIINLAANLDVSRDLNTVKKLLETNFLPVITILRYSHSHNVRRVLLTGTCEEYGFNPTPYHENQQTQPVSPYSLTKTLSAVSSEFFHRIYDLPIVFLRPFTFFGPFQKGNMFIPSLFRAIFQKDLIFQMSKGKQIREFNYICDISKAYVKALEIPSLEGEVINLGRGKGFRLDEVADLIVKLTNSPIILKKGDLRYREHELMSIITDTNKAEQLLNWKSNTQLEVGLSKTYDWYKEHLGFL